ncbi:MAG: alcohol dehydrogenase catalytic domain-containing protein [Ornithinimicrobium sp.]
MALEGNRSAGHPSDHPRRGSRPKILRPTDAIVKVTASCVCGSDLWPYRGINQINEPRRIGHEFVGVVQEVGPEVQIVGSSQFVIAPFACCDNTVRIVASASTAPTR